MFDGAYTANVPSSSKLKGPCAQTTALPVKRTKVAEDEEDPGLLIALLKFFLRPRLSVRGFEPFHKVKYSKTASSPYRKAGNP